METFLMILMLTALAGMVVFFVLAFVKGKDNRRSNFAKSGVCLFLFLAVAMILGSEDEAFQTFLGILMLTALAGMVVFAVLAFVKGKGNRLRNFAKSGGCLFVLLVIAIIGAPVEETRIAQEVTTEASAEAEEKAEQEEEAKKEQEAEEQVKKEEEERIAKEEEERKAKEEQEAKEAEEQAKKEEEERIAKEEEERKAKEEQEAKEAEEQAKKEEERIAKEEADRKAREEQEAEEASVTVSQEQAVRMAKDYLDYTAFSKSGLIDQLKYEGFSTKDATYAVENITVDWQEQAVKMAQDYLDYTSFSRQGLIEQLTYEGFSKEHATYAVGQVGL